MPCTSSISTPGSEPLGMWVSVADGRLIVRTVPDVDHLVVEAESPIPTVLTVTMGSVRGGDARTGQGRDL